MYIVYLVTDRARYLEKKNWQPKFVPNGQNLARNSVFCHFLKFHLLVFFEIAYNDSLQRFLTSSRGKIH